MKTLNNQLQCYQISETWSLDFEEINYFSGISYLTSDRYLVERNTQMCPGLGKIQGVILLFRKT